MSYTQWLCTSFIRIAVQVHLSERRVCSLLLVPVWSLFRTCRCTAFHLCFVGALAFPGPPPAASLLWCSPLVSFNSLFRSIIVNGSPDCEHFLVPHVPLRATFLRSCPGWFVSLIGGPMVHASGSTLALAPHPGFYASSCASRAFSDHFAALRANLLYFFF